MGRLEWPALEELLARTGTARFAYPTFALVEQLAPGTIAPRVLKCARGASTRRTREIVERFTPTAPILSQHVSIKERLMWADGPRQTARRLLTMIAPAEKQPWPVVLQVYRHRITRVLAGKLVLGAPPTAGGDKC